MGSTDQAGVFPGEELVEVFIPLPAIHVIPIYLTIAIVINIVIAARPLLLVMGFYAGTWRWVAEAAAGK